MRYLLLAMAASASAWLGWLIGGVAYRWLTGRVTYQGKDEIE